MFINSSVSKVLSGSITENFLSERGSLAVLTYFAVYVMAATLNILMKAISAEAYTLSFLLLKAYSAALQRTPRHHRVSTLRNTVQIELLLGISKIIKGTRQQRKNGRKKNVKEATRASCKQIHAHSSLLKGVSFSM